jgi:hypothetical protein
MKITAFVPPEDRKNATGGAPPAKPNGEARNVADAAQEQPFFDDGREAREHEPPQEPWPQPKPIPDGLLPVAFFDPSFLPTAVAPWAVDIADRMQCPVDFVGISAVAALGSVLGRKIGVRPKQKDAWIGVSNFWAMIIGRPGILKSPSMDEALKPAHRLEMAARKVYAEAMGDFKFKSEFYELQKADAKKQARKGKSLSGATFEEVYPREMPEEPKARRYITNDTTYEKLGVILAENPTGVMVFRDELISLLYHLEKEDQVSARQFFMTAWNGNSGYTFDRMIRGTVYLAHACLSLLGATTPSALSEYMQAVHKTKTGGDGLIQRFGLLVWPDPKPQWRNVDRFPDSEARDAAWDAFERLDQLTPDAAGAESDRYEDLPFLRFDGRAQGVFNEWRADLEALVRSGSLIPALESHLAKYRGLVPSLALVVHLADQGAGPIPEASVRKAINFVKYLETHARRAYASGTEAETSSAKAILAKIRKGDIKDGFRAREIQRSGWSNLSDRDDVQAGLDLLCDLDWLAAEARGPSAAGGRPSCIFRINPACLR